MFNKELYSANLAQNLKFLRENGGADGKKLSHNTLHERLDCKISTESLKNYEAMPFHPKRHYKNMGMSVEALCRLADFYGVSTDYLLGLTDIKSSNGNIKSAVQCTGLSEMNIVFLNDLCRQAESSGNTYFNFAILLINDLIENCAKSNAIILSFLDLQNSIARIRELTDLDEAYGYPTTEEVDDFIRKHSLTVLPMRSSAMYHAKQIGEAIEESLIEKYIHPLFSESND